MSGTSGHGVSVEVSGTSGHGVSVEVSEGVSGVLSRWIHMWRHGNVC